MHPDGRVAAVRGHRLVGRGTCSYIDETMSNDDLIKAFDDEGVTTSEGAINFALELEALWSDDDPTFAEHHKKVVAEQKHRRRKYI